MKENDKPLTNDEKLILLNAGWRFLNENYIIIPDDYDGSMASGISSIRRVLEGIQKKQARLIMVKPLLAEPPAPCGAVAGEVTPKQ